MTNEYHEVVAVKTKYILRLLFFMIISTYFRVTLSLSLFMWQAVSEKLQVLKKSLDEGDQGALGEIRKTVLGLVAPSELVSHIVSFC